MSLFALLEKRQIINRPVRVGVIGAATFSSAFLNQVRRVPGMKVVCIADLDGEKAARACITAGWPEAVVGVAHSPSGINEGAARGKMMVTESADDLIKADLEVIVEATGVTDDFA
jgi:predicted homoserine dehydrogenase-like protein